VGSSAPSRAVALVSLALTPRAFFDVQGVPPSRMGLAQELDLFLVAPPMFRIPGYRVRQPGGVVQRIVVHDARSPPRTAHRE
jgi:hypothetical protein